MDVDIRRQLPEEKSILDEIEAAAGNPNFDTYLFDLLQNDSIPYELKINAVELYLDKIDEASVDQNCHYLLPLLRTERSQDKWLRLIQRSHVDVDRIQIYFSKVLPFLNPQQINVMGRYCDCKQIRPHRFLNELFSQLDLDGRLETTWDAKRAFMSLHTVITSFSTDHDFSQRLLILALKYVRDQDDYDKWFVRVQAQPQPFFKDGIFRLSKERKYNLVASVILCCSRTEDENFSELLFERLSLFRVAVSEAEVVQSPCLTAYVHFTTSLNCCRTESEFKWLLKALKRDPDDSVLVVQRSQNAVLSVQKSIGICLNKARTSAEAIGIFVAACHLKIVREGERSLVPAVDFVHISVVLKKCKTVKDFNTVIGMITSSHDGHLLVNSQREFNSINASLTLCLDQPDLSAQDAIGILEKASEVRFSIPGISSNGQPLSHTVVPLVRLQQACTVLKKCQTVRDFNSVVAIMPRFHDAVLLPDEGDLRAIIASFTIAIDQDNLDPEEVVGMLTVANGLNLCLAFRASTPAEPPPIIRLLDLPHCCSALKKCRTVDHLTAVIGMMPRYRDSDRTLLVADARDLGVLQSSFMVCLEQAGLSFQEVLGMLKVANNVSLCGEFMASTPTELPPVVRLVHLPHCCSALKKCRTVNDFKTVIDMMPGYDDGFLVVTGESEFRSIRGCLVDCLNQEEIDLHVAMGILQEAHRFRFRTSNSIDQPVIQLSHGCAVLKRCQTVHDLNIVIDMMPRCRGGALLAIDERDLYAAKGSLTLCLDQDGLNPKEAMDMLRVINRLSVFVNSMASTSTEHSPFVRLLDLPHCCAALKKCRTLDDFKMIIEMMFNRHGELAIENEKNVSILRASLMLCLDQEGLDTQEAMRMLAMANGLKIFKSWINPSMQSKEPPTVQLLESSHCSVVLKTCRNLHDFNAIIAMMPRCHGALLAINEDDFYIIRASLTVCLNQANLDHREVASMFEAARSLTVWVGNSNTAESEQAPIVSLVNYIHCRVVLKRCQTADEFRMVIAMMSYDEDGALLISDKNDHLILKTSIIKFLLQIASPEQMLNILDSMAGLIIRKTDDGSTDLLLDSVFYNVAIRSCRTCQDLVHVLECAGWRKGSKPDSGISLTGSVIGSFFYFFHDCDPDSVIPALEEMEALLEDHPDIIVHRELYELVAQRCTTFDDVNRVWEIMKRRGLPISDRVLWDFVRLSDGHYPFVKELYETIPESRRTYRLTLAMATAALKHQALLDTSDAMSVDSDVESQDPVQVFLDDLMERMRAAESVDLEAELDMDMIDPNLGSDLDPDVLAIQQADSLVSTSEFRDDANGCLARMYGSKKLGTQRDHSDIVLVMPMRAPDYTDREPLDLYPEQVIRNWKESLPPNKTLRIVLGINTNETNKAKLLEVRQETEARIRHELGGNPNISVELNFFTWETQNGEVPFGFLRNVLLDSLPKEDPQVDLVVSMDGDTTVNPKLVEGVLAFHASQKVRDTNPNFPQLAFTSFGYRLGSTWPWLVLGTKLDYRLRQALVRESPKRQEMVTIAYSAEAFCVLSGRGLSQGLSNGSVRFDPFGNDGNGLARAVSGQIGGLPSVPPPIDVSHAPVVHNTRRFETVDPNNIAGICPAMSHARSHFFALRIVAGAGRGLTVAEVERAVNMVSPFNLLRKGMSFDNLKRFRDMLCGNPPKTSPLSQHLQSHYKMSDDRRNVGKPGREFNKTLYQLDSYFTGDSRNLVDELLASFGFSTLETIGEMRDRGVLVALRFIEKWVAEIVTFMDTDPDFVDVRPEFLHRISPMSASRAAASYGKCDSSLVFRDEDEAAAPKKTKTGSRPYGQNLSFTVTPLSKPVRDLLASQRELSPFSGNHASEQETPVVPQEDSGRRQSVKRKPVGMDDRGDSVASAAPLAVASGPSAKKTRMGGQVSLSVSQRSASHVDEKEDAQRVTTERKEDSRNPAPKRNFPKEVELDQEFGDELLVGEIVQLREILKRNKMLRELFNLVTPERLGRSKDSWNKQEQLETVIQELRKNKLSITAKDIHCLFRKIFFSEPQSSFA